MIRFGAVLTVVLVAMGLLLGGVLDQQPAAGLPVHRRGRAGRGDADRRRGDLARRNLRDAPARRARGAGQPGRRPARSRRPPAPRRAASVAAAPAATAAASAREAEAPAATRAAPAARPPRRRRRDAAATAAGSQPLAEAGPGRVRGQRPGPGPQRPGRSRRLRDAAHARRIRGTPSARKPHRFRKPRTARNPHRGRKPHSARSLRRLRCFRRWTGRRTRRPRGRPERGRRASSDTGQPGVRRPPAANGRPAGRPGQPRHGLPEFRPRPAGLAGYRARRPAGLAGFNVGWLLAARPACGGAAAAGPGSAA